MNKTLGIIGGMGPLATVTLFNKIVLGTEAQNDQEHIHIIIDNNTNIPDRTEFLVGTGLVGTEKDPTRELIKSAQMLEAAGVDFLIMPCNTAHYFYQIVKRQVNIDFLNMIEETLKVIQSKYPTSKKVGILGTDGTVKTKIYDMYFNKQNIEVVAPEKKTQQSLMDIIYGIKEGKRDVSIEPIYNAVEEFKSKGVEVFILGCTELSVINEMHNLDGNFVDALSIIAERAIEFAGKKVLHR